MKKFGEAVVKLRVPILILSVLLLFPSAWRYFHTRVNYDILSYLPEDIETMKGKDISVPVDLLPDKIRDAGKDYRSFAGISDDMEGKVRFIIKTDSITSGEEDE